MRAVTWELRFAKEQDVEGKQKEAPMFVLTTPRPEHCASASPYGRRIIWERRNPGLVTRPPYARSPTKFGPHQGPERKGWDVARADTGERVAGPWPTVEEMLTALERGAT